MAARARATATAEVEAGGGGGSSSAVGGGSGAGGGSSSGGGSGSAPASFSDKFGELDYTDEDGIYEGYGLGVGAGARRPGHGKRPRLPRGREPENAQGSPSHHGHDRLTTGRSWQLG